MRVPRVRAPATAVLAALVSVSCAAATTQTPDTFDSTLLVTEEQRPPDCVWRELPLPWVYFRVGSAELEPSLLPYDDVLDAVVRGFDDGRYRKMRARGSRAVGCPSEDRHDELELARARAVAEELVRRGIPAAQLTIGVTNSQPFTTYPSCDPSDPSRDPRRVVVIDEEVCPGSVALFALP